MQQLVPSAAFCVSIILSREFWRKQVLLYIINNAQRCEPGAVSPGLVFTGLGKRKCGQCVACHFAVQLEGEGSVL